MHAKKVKCKPKKDISRQHNIVFVKNKSEIILSLNFFSIHFSFLVCIFFFPACILLLLAWILFFRHSCYFLGMHFTSLVCILLFREDKKCKLGLHSSGMHLYFSGMQNFFFQLCKIIYVACKFIFWDCKIKQTRHVKSFFGIAICFFCMQYYFSDMWKWPILGKIPKL
jgi:hypothetical protein